MSEILRINLGLAWHWHGTLTLLANERLMNVRNNTTSSNSGFDQCVQLLVSTNSQLKLIGLWSLIINIHNIVFDEKCSVFNNDSYLQMSGSDSLHLEILGSVTSQLQHLSSEILQDGWTVDSSCGSNSASGETTALQMTMDSKMEIVLYFKIKF